MPSQNILCRRISQTATAFSMAALQGCLTHNRLISTVADTQPAVHPLPFARILLHYKLSEPLPYIILYQRFTQTSAAFPVTGSQLMQRRVYLAAAVAFAVPDQASASALRPGGIKRCQFSKPLAGNIPLPWLYHRFTATVPNCAALKRPGIQTDASATFTGTKPYRISIFSFRGLLYHSQLSDTKSGFDLHPFILFQFIPHPAIPAEPCCHSPCFKIGSPLSMYLQRTVTRL